MEDSEEKRNALRDRDPLAYRLRYSARYLGPDNLVMRFRNFNPLMDPRIEASQYEDALPDVGQEEMERRFHARRVLFLDLYDPAHPRQSLPRYMKAAQEREGYQYKPPASAGPLSMYLGGSVPKHLQKGQLPECQLLGFVDARGTVGCLAHPLAETSRGYDGRDLVGFFHHTGCCDSVGCEASKEFKFLSASALRVFDKAVQGMSWYRYSRHATSVLVYYLRAYDHILQMLDERQRLDALTMERLVGLTNGLYDGWPLKRPDSSASLLLSSLDILSMDIPLAERVMYLALDTGFLPDRFEWQLRQAREHVGQCIMQFDKQ